MSRSCHIFAFAALAFLLPTDRSKADDELLRTAVAGHKATLDAIHTLHCKLEKTFSPVDMGSKKAKPVDRESGEYWRVGGDCRGRSRTGERFSEGSWRDGVTRSYWLDAERTGDYDRGGSISTKDMPHHCDAWSYAQMTFYGSVKFRVPLEKLVGEPGTKASARRATRGGRELIRVDVSHARADMRIWLDPSVGYLARSVEMTVKWKGGSSENETVVEEFGEFAAGIRFPTRIRCDSTSFKDISGDKGKKQWWLAVLSDVSVNGPLAPESLDVRFPPGLLVGDDIRDGMFRTDAKGDPVLPAKNAQGQLLTLSKEVPKPSYKSQNASTYPTQEEPESSSRWILQGSLLLLLIAAIVWSVRQVRARRAGV